MPDSKNGKPWQSGPWSDFRLSNKANNDLRYLMNIDDGKKNHNFRWGSNQHYPYGRYTGWKPSNVLDCSSSTGENMELTISIYDDMGAVPDGVYSDTMEITVYPE